MQLTRVHAYTQMLIDRHQASTKNLERVHPTTTRIRATATNINLQKERNDEARPNVRSFSADIKKRTYTDTSTELLRKSSTSNRVPM